MHGYELRLAEMQLWMNWRSDSVNTVIANNMLLMTGTHTAFMILLASTMQIVNPFQREVTSEHVYLFTILCLSL